MLTRDMEIEDEIQTLAATFAEKNSNTNVYLALLNIRNLLPEIDVSISKRSEADILVNWANRKGRTTEELLARFENEKRVTLLSQLAERDGLPEELYKAFARMGKTTLSQAIISNSKAPHSAKVIAAKTAVAGLKSNSTTQGKVNALFKDQHEEVANNVISSATSLATLAGVVALVNKDKHEELAKRAALLMKSGEHLGDYYTTLAIKQIFSFVRTVDGKTAMRETLKDIDSRNGLRYSNELKNLISAPDIDPVQIALEEISSEDASIIAAALALIESKGNRMQFRDALDRAVLNLSTDTATIKKYAGKVDYARRKDVIVRLQEDMDVIADHLVNTYDDSNLYEYILLDSNGLRDKVLSTDYSARDLLISILKKRTTFNVVKGKLARYAQDIFLEYGDINYVLESLPTAVANSLIKELASKPKEWAIFESLLPEWQGSLNDLIACSKNIG